MALAYSVPGATVHLGDCLDVLPGLPADTAHAVVTDAPYGMEFMGRDWDAPWRTGNGLRRSRNPADAGRDTAFGRVSRTSPEYAAGPGYQQWCAQWAAACARVLRPGGHLVTFGGTRTAHRLACGLEDAGLEIRDTIDWIYAQGFPKSLNVANAIRKAFRGTPLAERALDWEGWGTALKPSHEPILIARKPFHGTVAANVVEYQTGGLHIDAARTGTREAADEGRWPANTAFTHASGCTDDGSCLIGCPIAELVDQTGTHRSGANPTRRHADNVRVVYGRFAGDEECHPARGPETGTADRYFPVFRYEPKASPSERPRLPGIVHPTVKPLQLMRWLVRLVAPPGGTVLDPFAGTGTTLHACLLEGVESIGIEKNPAYLELCKKRLAGVAIA